MLETFIVFALLLCVVEAVVRYRTVIRRAPQRLEQYGRKRLP